jgi:hypothetical protein
MCTSVDHEIGLVPYRRTDVYGYDSKNKVLYLCEIKVQRTDLPKVFEELPDQERRVKKTPEYIQAGVLKVIPVLAVSNNLYQEVSKHYPDEWKSTRSTCKKLGMSIWVVEQSRIQYLQGIDPTNVNTKAVTKSKPAAKIKTATKAKATGRTYSATKTKNAGKTKTAAKITTKIKTNIRVKAATKPKSAARAKATAATKTTPRPKSSVKTKVSTKATRSKATIRVRRKK